MSSCKHVAAWILATGLATALSAQVINLDTVIGADGTNAATVAGIGNPVNFTGYANDSTIAATVLTATGSVGSSEFNFNTGFSDTFDRATGSTAGAGNVFVGRKYDSSSTGPLLLDTNGDGSFAGENPQSGFGMHGDTFITFDLDVIRAAAGIGAGSPLSLTGLAGLANPGTFLPTSGAIIADSTQLAVFDWTSGAGQIANTFNLTLGGSTRYLTFIALSGKDADNFYAHVGFGNVQLQAVPEPPAICLVGIGLATLGWRCRRRSVRPENR